MIWSDTSQSLIRPKVKELLLRYIITVEYLAFSRIQHLAQRTGTILILKPFLVGGVFNQVNQTLYAVRDKLLAPLDKKTKRSPKSIWMEQDMKHWAEFLDLDIKSIE